MRLVDVEKKDAPARRIESSKYEAEKSSKSKELIPGPKNKTPSLSGAQNPPTGWRKFLKLWKNSSIKRLPPLVAPKVSRRFSRSARESCDFDKCPAADRCPYNPNWRTFTLAHLKAATNNFSQGHCYIFIYVMYDMKFQSEEYSVLFAAIENLIGKGGYSQVYKGCLANGQLVAVKRLKKGMGEEDLFNFLSEIGIIAHINHPNTAKMIGYGVEGGAFLVLQLSSLGSLSSRLHGN